MRLTLSVPISQRLAPALIILALIMSMATGCGRKAPPVWLEPTELASPSELTLTYREGEVSISWDYPAEMMPYIEGFRVEMFNGAAFVSSTITRGMVFRSSDAEGFSYRVSVAGRRSGVKEGVSALISPPVDEVLEPPSGLSAGMTADGLKLVWERVMGATSYEVYKRNKNGSESQEPAVKNIRGLEFIDTAPLAGEGETMVYSVRATRISVAGGATTVVSGPASAPLEVDADMFRPAAPSGVAITRSGTKVLVYWDVSPENWVKGYRVYRVNSEGKQHPVAKTVTPAYSEIPPGNARVGYAVSAYGESLEGPISPTVWVKPPSAR